jgi:hypothetical protein
MTESFQSSPSAAGWSERMSFIFVLLIQQNAFVSILMLVVNGVPMPGGATKAEKPRFPARTSVVA